MKLKPFADMIKLTKEGIDKVLAPVRCRQVKSQAYLEMAKIDEKIITLEAKVQEMCVEKTIAFFCALKLQFHQVF